MPHEHYDFGNLCEIFYNILDDIETAILTCEPAKALDKCSKAKKYLKEWRGMPGNEYREMIHE